MSMSKRIESIAAELERLKLEEEAPVDDLSRSLFNLGEKLARLDTLEKAALLAEFNRADPLERTDSLNLDMESLGQFILDYKRG
ncbi:MAG: hypothetical protein HFF49_12270 [Lawsonibacter sp.]|jgi:hypothetical protein|nr:hypothetical protein [Lawsonibacter sp.]